MEDPVERVIDELTQRPVVLDPSKFLKENWNDKHFKYFLETIFTRIRETQDATFDHLEKIIGSDFSGAVQDALGKASFEVDKFGVDNTIYFDSEQELFDGLTKLVKKSKKTITPGEED